jgi:hypothetical protein
MKFLRQFAAVVLTVAVIVGLGMLWAHDSGSGAGIGGGLRQAPIRAGVIRVQSDNGFNLADTSDLIRTGEIESALAAVVITVSAIQRRRRRMRRATATRP